ncbi:unnamed protein product [Gongylonema pulchrum]|uniref:Myotubularin phosphatase domain-containing protein n=1 Tax=Gongylonema pulchrum TaxID=637853 RepID=A0A183DY20_9BILA|nr:unnamed protein product [Gongylonema pulchrum]
MSSGDDSSQEDDFRSDVLAAVGMTPGGSSSLSLIQNKLRQGDRFWVLPGEKIQIEETNIGYMSPVGKVNGRVLVTNYRLRFEAKPTSENRHSKTNIGYMSPVGKVNGRVLVTNYRLRFEAKPTSENRHSKCCQFDVPLGCISRVEKVGYSTVSRGEDSYGLEITCKPFFAVFYKPEWTIDGWNIFDTIREFNRMLAVPATAIVEGEDFLQKVGEFRSKQRIPVLSWLHPITQASITRSSQPMVGVTSRKSAEDERYCSAS